MDVDQKRERELAIRLGQAIAKERARCGLTQGEVSERIGIGTEQVSRIERGMTFPSVRRLVEFAELFNCSVDTLVRRGSDLLPDQEAMFHDILAGMKDTRDREFLLSLAEQFSTHMGGKKH